MNTMICCSRKFQHGIKASKITKRVKRRGGGGGGGGGVDNTVRASYFGAQSTAQ